jgi:CRISPR-associated endonuclease/helicase Cas3
MAEETPLPDASTRWLETSRGLLRYTELAPLLAERVLRVQQGIEAEAYAGYALDEDLLRALHGDSCGDLVPQWAGRWRTIAVRVGSHEPPAPHLVPLEMRNYALDLRARLDASPAVEDWPEFLAFAEGRLLTIHPFADFNGRVARLWLWELLRRLDLPPVSLADTEAAARQRYLAALRAADARDYRPLAQVWRDRLIATDFD